MHKATKTIEIKAPVQRVYDFMTQPTNMPSIWPNMISVSNVVTQPGGAHEYDYLYKMAGVHFKGHVKTVETQPAKLVRVATDGGISSNSIWTYSGLDGGNTRLSVEFEYTIPTPVIGKLAEALVAKLNERELENVLANLKDMIEGTATGVAAGARAH